MWFSDSPDEREFNASYAYSNPELYKPKGCCPNIVPGDERYPNCFSTAPPQGTPSISHILAASYHWTHSWYGRKLQHSIVQYYYTGQALDLIVTDKILLFLY